MFKLKQVQPTVSDSDEKMLDIAMWSEIIRSLISSKNYVWICGEQVRHQPQSRSNAEMLSGIACKVMNCWFMFHQFKDNQTQEIEIMI